jgi:hypothetical protein
MLHDLVSCICSKVHFAFLKNVSLGFMLTCHRLHEEVVPDSGPTYAVLTMSLDIKAALHPTYKPASLTSSVEVVDVEVIVCATHLRVFADKKDFLCGNTQINQKKCRYSYEVAITAIT